MNIPKEITQLPKDIIILTYSVLIGTSPLIPVPFIDEYVGWFFQRRLTYDLAKSYGIKLSNQETRILSGQRSLGCTEGCLFAISYPFKEILRELLFWKEIVRGIDLATHAYYSGFLLNEVFQNNLYDPAQVGLLYRLVQNAKAKTNTKFVKDAFKKSFRSSKGIIKTSTQWLFHFGIFAVKKGTGSLLKRVRRRMSPVDKMAQQFDLDRYFETVQPDFPYLLKELLDHLKEDIASIPADHFEELKTRFYDILRQEGIVNSQKT